MALSKRKLEILKSMKPGEWYNCDELGTSRKLLVDLQRDGYLRRKIDKDARGYKTIDVGVKFALKDAAA